MPAYIAVSRGGETSSQAKAAKLVAGVSLYSFAGGYADALGFLVSGSFTGHVTGNFVLSAISLALGHWQGGMQPVSAIIVFLMATAVGLRLATRNPDSSHWLLACGQCLLILSLGLPVVRAIAWYGYAMVVVFCLSLGLQNGIVTASSGTTIHSTYLTGTATRLLQSIQSQDVAVQDAKPSSAVISLAVIAGFVVGAMLATIAHARLRQVAPFFLCLPLGAAAVLQSTGHRGARA